MRVVYGINPVTEALRSGRGADRLLVSAKREDRAVKEITDLARSRGVRVERTSPDKLAETAGAAAHQGVALVMKGAYPYRTIEDLIEAWKESGRPAFFLLLDSVQDPQNLGSLVRAACAAGVHGVVIPKDRAAEVTPAVTKASAGATEHVLIARETNLARVVNLLKDEGVWVAALEADSPQGLYSADLSGDMALVVGGEATGVRRLVRKSCDFTLSIPMHGGFNSLNAAQAGAVALFETRRQRLAAGGA